MATDCEPYKFMDLDRDDKLYTPFLDGTVDTRDDLGPPNGDSEFLPTEHIRICLMLNEICCKRGSGEFRVYPNMREVRARMASTNIEGQFPDPLLATRKHKNVPVRNEAPAFVFFSKDWTSEQVDFFENLTPFDRVWWCQTDRGGIPAGMPVLNIDCPPMHKAELQRLPGPELCVTSMTPAKWTLEHSLPDSNGRRNVYFVKKDEWWSHATKLPHSDGKMAYFAHAANRAKPVEQAWLGSIRLHGYEGLVDLLNQKAINAQESDEWQNYQDTVHYWLRDRPAEPPPAQSNVGLPTFKKQ